MQLFTQPSTGTVSSNETALEVTNNGSGAALSGTSASGDGSVGKSSAQLSAGVHGYSSGQAAGVWGENGGRPSWWGTQNALEDPRFSAGVRGSNWEQGGINTAVAGVYAECPSGIGLIAWGGAAAASFQGDILINRRVLATGDVAGGRILSNGTGTFAADVTITSGNLNVSNGNVVVAGDVQLTNGDCAEEFDLLHEEAAAPGTVMVLSDDGRVAPSRDAYDRRVAGVISGAGDLKPAILLGRRADSRSRAVIALMGTVYCKVDADEHAIAIGDLLTTSPIEGHAMKALDPARAFGAVIGKAMRGLQSGRGLIPVLIALQ